jgi:hypothetical protein
VRRSRSGIPATITHNVELSHVSEQLFDLWLCVRAVAPS